VLVACIPVDTRAKLAHGRRRSRFNRAIRRWHRQDYLRRYAQDRRTSARTEGSRRIDVTRSAKPAPFDGPNELDDFATVRGYLENLNQIIADINTRPGKSEKHWRHTPVSLDAPNVIRTALSIAATAIRERKV
jgi:hypothetical protein